MYKISTPETGIASKITRLKPRDVLHLYIWTDWTMNYICHHVTHRVLPV